MDDRELLKLAAKASGIEFGEKPASGVRWENGIRYLERGSEYITPGIYHVIGFNRDGPITEIWQPLHDDGDIARLESALDIDVYWYKDNVSSHAVGRHFWVDEQYSDHGGDKNKARRYASTRAAAEIGRLM